jgi:hypothetical protein
MHFHEFCFVLFCFAHAEISQTMVLFMLCSSETSESSGWMSKGVQPLGLRMFGATVWKLYLIIESF